MQLNKKALLLVADPFAEEKHWLPACEVTSTKRTSMVRILKTIKPFLFALALGAALTSLYMVLVQLGFDWGYKLIENYYGQPDGEAQGLGAISQLVYLVFPCVFGLTFGASRVHFYKKKNPGLLWPTLAFSLTFAAGLGVVLFHEATADLTETMSAIGMLTAAFAAFIASGLKIGSWIYAELQQRVRTARIFAWNFFALLPAVAIWFMSSFHSWQHEIVVYFLTLLTAACIAAKISRSKNSTAGVMAGAFALLPIMCSNFINLATNAIGLSLGLSDWHAMASAAGINAVAAVAICTGGIVAVRTNRKAARPCSLTNQT